MQLHIDVSVNKNTRASIKIMDATGKIVQIIETEFKKGINTNILDTRSLAAGLYLVNVVDGFGLNYSQKFKKD